MSTDIRSPTWSLPRVAVSTFFTTVSSPAKVRGRPKAPATTAVSPWPTFNSLREAALRRFTNVVPSSLAITSASWRAMAAKSSMSCRCFSTAAARSGCWADFPPCPFPPGKEPTVVVGRPSVLSPPPPAADSFGGSSRSRGADPSPSTTCGAGGSDDGSFDPPAAGFPPGPRSSPTRCGGSRSWGPASPFPSPGWP